LKIFVFLIDIYPLFLYNITMKRTLTTIILFLVGMTVFSQNMSTYTTEYMRADGTFVERLAVLESVRDSGTTGIGEFYHDALRFLLLRAPDIRSRTEQDAAERSAAILCQGLGAEGYSDAAGDIWQVAAVFDVVRDATDGNAMQSSLIALGQIGATEFVPQIVQRLNNFNAQTVSNPETRRRIQMAVVGCISALEALQDIRGYRPVFFASVGTYDPSIREIAANALPNIAEDPADVIIAIIQDPSSPPNVKLTAWNEMLKTRAPDSSKTRVAAAALATSFNYTTNNRNFQMLLSEMRKGAIDIIRQFGVSDNSVYNNLEKTYASNFINNAPDYDEIMLTLNALAAIKTDEAVGLLYKFLQELHGRRRSGPWANKERRLFEWVVSCLGATGTQSVDVRILLTTIQRTETYTSQEQNMAASALRDLGMMR
jgi:HEAT repeat protein